MCACCLCSRVPYVYNAIKSILNIAVIDRGSQPLFHLSVVKFSILLSYQYPKPSFFSDKMGVKPNTASHLRGTMISVMYIMECDHPAPCQ